MAKYLVFYITSVAQKYTLAGGNLRIHMGSGGGEYSSAPYSANPCSCPSCKLFGCIASAHQAHLGPILRLQNFAIQHLGASTVSRILFVMGVPRTEPVMQVLLVAGMSGQLFAYQLVWKVQSWRRS